MGGTRRVAGRRGRASGAGSATPATLIPAGVSAVVALVAAGLALIGVTGGVLVRAVRSSPGTIVLAITVLVVLAVLAERAAGRFRLGLVVAMLAVVLLTLGLGATSIDERDKPSVSLKASSTSASTSAPGKWTVTVKATASGLRAREDMLVQLQGLPDGIPTDGTTFDTSYPSCQTSTLRSTKAETDAQAAGRPYPPPAGALLLWTQAGPSADGSIVVESSVDVPLNSYRGVCAVAIYSSSRGYGVEGVFDRIQSWLNLPTGNEVKVSVGYIAMDPS